jgi:polyisoprenoid-binding protein YceI
MLIAHVKGIFKIFNANIYTENTDFRTATIELYIDADSIKTDNEKRDNHLKSDDFFDVNNHKQIQFTSNSIKKTKLKGVFELHGMLSIKGFPQAIVLNVEFKDIVIDSFGNERAIFVVTGNINIIAWGLGWDKPLLSLGIVSSEDVNISCEIELINETQKGLKSRLGINPNQTDINLSICLLEYI